MSGILVSSIRLWMCGRRIVGPSRDDRPLSDCDRDEAHASIATGSPRRVRGIARARATAIASPPPPSGTDGSTRIRI
jgi:hypothetical protein